MAFKQRTLTVFTIANCLNLPLKFFHLFWTHYKNNLQSTKYCTRNTTYEYFLPWNICAGSVHSHKLSKLIILFLFGRKISKFCQKLQKRKTDHCKVQTVKFNSVLSFVILTRGGVEDTRLEAKDTKKFRGQGHKKISRPRPSQECSRPRTKDTDVSVLQKKRRSSKLFFRQSQKKVFKNFFQA